MNKVIAIVIVVGALGIGVYFLFFFNKGSGVTGTTTPQPSYADEDDAHYIAPMDEPMNIVVSTDLVKELLFQFELYLRVSL